jgi:cAMP phosphodiesterase
MNHHSDTASFVATDSPLRVRVLGCDGSIARGARTTAFLVNEHLLVDAGTGVGDLTLAEMDAIEHVVLTHSHLDHIAALPLMLDAVGNRRGRPLQVHALPDTIAALKTHVFNDLIWPDFSRLPTVDHPFVSFHPVLTGQRIELGGVWVEALPACHTVSAVGYAVTRGLQQPHWVFSGDTGDNPAFWRRVNQLPLAALVIETAFSEREAGLARLSQHLCPSALLQQLEHLSPSSECPIFITHTKPIEAELIMEEIDHLNRQRLTAGLRPRAISRLQAGHEWVF